MSADPFRVLAVRCGVIVAAGKDHARKEHFDLVDGAYNALLAGLGNDSSMNTGERALVMAWQLFRIVRFDNPAMIDHLHTALKVFSHSRAAAAPRHTPQAEPTYWWQDQ